MLFCLDNLVRLHRAKENPDLAARYLERASQLRDQIADSREEAAAFPEVAMGSIFNALIRNLPPSN